MRALIIGLGLAAMLVAAVLASRENTAHVNGITQPVPSLSTTPQRADGTAAAQITVQPNARSMPTRVQKATSAAAGFFFVREPEAVVVYDASTASPLQELPLQGILSADRKHYYFVDPGSPTYTIVAGFDADAGGVTDWFDEDGHWKLGGVSATGRWIALMRIPGETEIQDQLKANQWKTQLRITDSTKERTEQSLELDGNFDVDAISADGTSLFLIQHLPASNPDHYQVRLYDLMSDQLQEGALVDKRAPDEVMAGYPWDAVASPDGKWLLTLYLRTRDNTAFIHALNLENRFAMCIDLPSGKQDLSQLKHYTLTLAPDGRTVYAIDPALGILAIVDLNQFDVSRFVSFASLSVNTESQLDTPPSRSVVSRDGRMVYWADGTAVESYDTQTQTVESLWEMESPVLGLFVSAESGQLYIAHEGGQVQILDAGACTAANNLATALQPATTPSWTPEAAPAVTPIPGWTRFRGNGTFPDACPQQGIMEIWLPASYVGGDLNANRDEVLAKLRALEPEFEKPGHELTRTSDTTTTLYVLDSKRGSTGLRTSIRCFRAPGQTNPDVLWGGAVDILLGDSLHQATDQFQEIRSKNIVALDGFTARELLLEGSISDIQVKRLVYWIENDDVVWVCAYTSPADEFEERLPTFEQSIRSFSILP